MRFFYYIQLNLHDLSAYKRNDYPKHFKSHIYFIHNVLVRNISYLLNYS